MSITTAEKRKRFIEELRVSIKPKCEERTYEDDEIDELREKLEKKFDELFGSTDV